MSITGKTYFLSCSFCGFKAKSDGTDGNYFVEKQTSKLQATIAKLDPVTKKVIPAKFVNQRKRFKCPDCGRIIFPLKLKQNGNEPENNDS